MTVSVRRSSSYSPRTFTVHKESSRHRLVARATTRALEPTKSTNMSVDLTMFSAPAFLGIGKNTTPNLSRVTRHQPTQRHQESAIESRSTHSARNDCFFDEDASVIFGHHDKSSASDQMMGGATIVPTSSGESSPKRCGQANGRSNSGRAHVRRGKWLPEEQAYAEQIIHDFEAGLLPLRNGATLRAYLSGQWVHRFSQIPPPLPTTPRHNFFPTHAPARHESTYVIRLMHRFFMSDAAFLNVCVGILTLLFVFAVLLLAVPNHQSP